MVIIIVVSVVQSAKRRKDMEAVVAQLGLTFYEDDPFGLPALHGDMLAFSEGHSRTAYNIMRGEKDGVNTIITDYRYTVGSGKNSHTYYRTYCILDTGKSFAHLQVRPENFLDTIAAWVGFDDIDFEYKEFNDAFYVRCNDKKFAYDIIHPKMMEYLLQNRGVHFEMAGKSILAHYNNRLAPDEIAPLIKFAQGIYGLLPTYV